MAGLSLAQLQAIMPRLPPKKAAEYLPHLSAAMEEFQIAWTPGPDVSCHREHDGACDCGALVGRVPSPARMAAFLAQLAHESGELRWLEEFPHKTWVKGCRACEAYLPGSVWSGRIAYDPTKFLGHEAGAQYEGRKDLGNTEPGDGVRFKGRGPIQLTGRSNYIAAGKALGLDLANQPEMAATPEIGFRVAGWFWARHDLNEMADFVPAPTVEPHIAREAFRRISRRVNGGDNGEAERWAYYLRAREVLRVENNP